MAARFCGQRFARATSSLAMTASVTVFGCFAAARRCSMTALLIVYLRGIWIYFCPFRTFCQFAIDISL